MGNALSLTLAIGVPLVGGMLNGMSTANDVKTWYRTIKKPTWTPPNWLFGPVWSVLYISMGIASHKVWKKTGLVGGAVPLGLYAGQLVLNMLWTPLFFKKHDLALATIDSAAMVGMATAATLSMSKATSAAEIVPLMAPYIAWISFATALTYRIYTLNNQGKPTHGNADMKKEA